MLSTILGPPAILEQRGGGGKEKEEEGGFAHSTERLLGAPIGHRAVPGTSTGKPHQPVLISL